MNHLRSMGLVTLLCAISLACGPVARAFHPGSEHLDSGDLAVDDYPSLIAWTVDVHLPHAPDWLDARLSIDYLDDEDLSGFLRQRLVPRVWTEAPAGYEGPVDHSGTYSAGSYLKIAQNDTAGLRFAPWLTYAIAKPGRYVISAIAIEVAFDYGQSWQKLVFTVPLLNPIPFSLEPGARVFIGHFTFHFEAAPDAVYRHQLICTEIESFARTPALLQWIDAALHDAAPALALRFAGLAWQGGEEAVALDNAP